MYVCDHHLFQEVSKTRSASIHDKAYEKGEGLYIWSFEWEEKMKDDGPFEYLYMYQYGKGDG